MTGATSSESSDPEPRRRSVRAVRQRRLPGMRRRHLNVTDLNSTSCRPQTGSDQQVSCEQSQEPTVSLPQVHLLEIRTSCDAANSFSPSNTSHHGVPPSTHHDNQFLDVTRLANSSSPACSSQPTVSTVNSKSLSAPNSGSERVNGITTLAPSLSSTSINNSQTMSVPRAFLNESPPISCSMSSQMPSQLARQPHSQSQTSTHRLGVESSTAATSITFGQDQSTGPMHSSESSAAANSGQRQVVKETITAVRVPMMRPNPYLLQVIRAAGGIGDVFTMRQIIHHVKNYIGRRLMYDMRNPSITYCDGDLLGQALGVKQFSILEAIGLFQRSCTPVQEYCIRTIRHLEAVPDTEVNSQTAGIGGSSNQSATMTSARAPEEMPTISDIHAYRETAPSSGLLSSCSSQGLPSSQSLSSSNTRFEESKCLEIVSSQEIPTSTTDDSTITTSLSASQELSSGPSSTEVSSSFGSQNIGPLASQTVFQDLSQPSPPSQPSQPSSSFSSSASSTSAVINFKASQPSIRLSDEDVKNTQSDQSSTDSSCDRTKPKPIKQENGIFMKENRISTSRARSTSINVSLDEPDGGGGAWKCCVSVQTGRTSNSEDYSAQNAEDDTVVVEYESDHFSVEYEVASSSDEQGENETRQPGSNSRSRNMSETSSLSSGLGSATAMLIVCKESDVEYLADYSDTDTGSDVELSEGDKWVCSYCNIKNPPFQRNCGGCWSVRSDWLPQSSSSLTAMTADDTSRAGEGCDRSIKGTRNTSESERNPSEDQSLRDDKFGPLSGKGVSPDKSKSQTDASKASAAACKARAKKRHYSSGLSTSDSQDDCPKNKSKVTDMTDAKGSEETKPKEADSSVKSVLVKDKSENRPRKQHHSPYSEKTLGALSRTEACVVCLTRPKTASIIHGKTGHQVCCYHCAKKLKKQRRACPICRKPIQKVIRNYHV